MADLKQQTKGGDAHHHGVGRYYVVYFALLLGTLLTLVTAKIDLGAANIFVAMAIATTKATLVVLFFMHLSESGGVIRLVFVVSILFVAVLMLGVFGDLLTRNPMTLPNGGPMAPGTRLQGAMSPSQGNAPRHGASPAHAPAPTPAH